MGIFRKLFTKDVDRQVEAIMKQEVTPLLHGAAQTSSSLTRLLKKDGITLRIFIATGGDRRHA